MRTTGDVEFREVMSAMGSSSNLPNTPKPKAHLDYPYFRESQNQKLGDQW